jgi:hypothetical protein
MMCGYFANVRIFPSRKIPTQNLKPNRNQFHTGTLVPESGPRSGGDPLSVVTVMIAIRMFLHIVAHQVSGKAAAETTKQCSRTRRTHR